MKLALYSYFRSSAAYRVRIALNLKGLAYDLIPVSLVRDGGDQLGAAYRAVNPAALVPSLAADGAILTQSLAIIEFLDEQFPEPPLMPKAALDRAWVRSIALGIACEIHPLNNLRVLRYLEHELELAAAARTQWYRHWVMAGLQAIETQLAGRSQRGGFCVGDHPTIADCCLVPQLFNARRFGCRLDSLTRLLRIESHCLALEAFQQAAPAAQPDAS